MYRMTRAVSWVGLALCLISLHGTASAGGGSANSARSETKYGIISIGRPTIIPGEAMQDTFAINTSAIDFNKALTEGSGFQSSGLRRFSNQQDIALKASADLLKMQQLQQAAKAGLPPPEGSTTPPALGAGTLNLAPPEGFLAGGLKDQTVAIPFSDRMMTAMTDSILARFFGELPGIFKKMRNEYDMYFILSSLTVIPGEYTANNGTAQVKLRYTVNDGKVTGTPAEPLDYSFTPIFPTRQTANISDDAASLDATRLLIELLAAYGPAQASGSYQQAINDLKRLSSARQIVTVSGSMVDRNTTYIQVKGLRSADPFGERRPSGKMIMEPVTLPVIHLVAIRKGTGDVSTEKSEEGQSTKRTTDDLRLDAEFSGRWIYRHWRINPARWFGFGYGSTKYMSSGKSISSAIDTIPQDGSYQVAFERDLGPEPLKLKLAFAAPVNSDNPAGDVLSLTHGGDQQITVRAVGSSAGAFFLEGLPLEIAKAEKLKAKKEPTQDARGNPADGNVRLYTLKLRADDLQALLLAKGGSSPSVSDLFYSFQKPATPVDLCLYGVNDLGESNALKVKLDFGVAVPRSRLVMEDGATRKSFEANPVAPFSPEVLKAFVEQLCCEKEKAGKDGGK